MKCDWIFATIFLPYDFIYGQGWNSEYTYIYKCIVHILAYTVYDFTQQNTKMEVMASHTLLYNL